MSDGLTPTAEATSRGPSGTPGHPARGGMGGAPRRERPLEPLREVVDALAVALALGSLVFEGHARISPGRANLAPPALDFAEVLKTPPTGASCLYSERCVPTLILELTPLVANCFGVATHA